MVARPVTVNMTGVTLTLSTSQREGLCTHPNLNHLREIILHHGTRLAHLRQSDGDRVLRDGLVVRVDCRERVSPELEAHGCDGWLGDGRGHLVELELEVVSQW